MPTPQEIRKIRIENDYVEMKNIKGNVIDWKVVKGSIPCVEAYELTINIKTIVGALPSYRSEHNLLLELPEDYPNVPPLINMRTNPQPYHPNWYTNGNWCYGTWVKSESLGHFVVRMVRTLQFDLDITNPDSPANREAKDWFVSKLGSSLFPCDRTILPDPTHSKFKIQTNIKKKFNLQ